MTVNKDACELLCSNDLTNEKLECVCYDYFSVEHVVMNDLLYYKLRDADTTFEQIKNDASFSVVVQSTFIVTAFEFKYKSYTFSYAGPSESFHK